MDDGKVETVVNCMTDDSPDQRVDELEQEVKGLRETVQKMMPSRRDVLRMGGAAAVGAAGMAGATGGASAGSDQVGTIGTASQPVDIEAEDIVAESVNTSELTDGSGTAHSGELADIADIPEVPSFAFETGTEPTPQGGGTIDISFANAYDKGILTVSVMITSQSTEAYEGWRKSWNTDGNGNITGATIYGMESSGDDPDMKWDMFGVVA